ncbi:hypothetical protein Lalb_Chr10g0105461 [Lupinus albus]|uniref:Uncharacterized protein n=1 Tax=Lupinus albus TaxID=3870 RepID=A0A6A4PY42_LUPAL|nr:hypothetical protein Lalb_Chr10g0105461 [Lupinus albus]
MNENKKRKDIPYERNGIVVSEEGFDVEEIISSCGEFTIFKI